MSNFSDNRSNKFAFVPFCTLAQAFHAEGLVKYEWSGIIKPIIQIFMDYDINIIQMPCLETLFHGGTSTGLNRPPKGMKYYDTEEFHNLCRDEAIKVVDQISGIYDSGYEVAVILGMEYSPSCAIKLQYPPKKGTEGTGIYIQELKKLLDEKGFEIPFLGINRRGIKPTLKRLENILN